MRVRVDKRQRENAEFQEAAAAVGVGVGMSLSLFLPLCVCVFFLLCDIFRVLFFFVISISCFLKSCEPNLRFDCEKM